MNRFGKPVVAVAAGSALALLAGLAAPATAATAATGGSCRGLALSVAGTTLSDANAPRTPCAADRQTMAATIVPLFIGSLRVQALQGLTKFNDAHTAQIAAARVASLDVTLLGLTLVKAKELAAGAGSGLDGCTSVGRSAIASITVLGQQIPLNGSEPITVTLPLRLGSIYLNQQVATANSIVQRALFIDLPGTFLDVIVAEASTGCSTDSTQQVQSMTVSRQQPSKALVRSVRERIERLRRHPQLRSALTVEQARH
jgi:hypothetical protein